MMTGPTKAVLPPKNQIEETYEERAAFLAWLYHVEYWRPSRAGALAQQIHHADMLAYRVLRNRASYAWVRQIAKRNWQIDAELLMSVWREWKAVQL